jgi:hypothetical protein
VLFLIELYQTTSEAVSNGQIIKNRTWNEFWLSLLNWSFPAVSCGIAWHQPRVRPWLETFKMNICDIFILVLVPVTRMPISIFFDFFLLELNRK